MSFTPEPLPDDVLGRATPRTRVMQDALLVRRWFSEGRRYQWMTEEYDRLFGEEVPPAFWANYRRRHGVGRTVDNEPHPLIPWRVSAEHRWAYHLTLLRLERRRVEGRALTERDEQHLAAWKQVMRTLDLVVVYDPASDEGFSCEPRRDGDDELVRPPTGASGDPQR